MIYKQLYICDVEPVYLKRLTSFLNRHPGFLWRIKTYTDPETCFKQNPECLLISGCAFKASNEWIQLLKMRGCLIILLEDNTEITDFEPRIQKYQSAEKVYEDLLEILSGEKIQHMEVIGIYGPSNGPDAEDYAKKIAKETSKSDEVLIIPMTEYSTFESDESNGIGEWFYYHSRHSNEKFRLSDWTYRIQDIDYIHGFRTVYDYKEVTLEEWKSFFEEGLKKSKYTTVIMVYDRLPEYIELFTWCNKIYVRWGDDGFGKLRKQIFEKMTNYMGRNELISKMECF